MDKREGDETTPDATESLIPAIFVRLEVADRSPVPKSLNEFFLQDLAMASAEDMEKNSACLGRRSLVDMEVHTVAFVAAESSDGAGASPVPLSASPSSAAASSVLGQHSPGLSGSPKGNFADVAVVDTKAAAGGSVLGPAADSSTSFPGGLSLFGDELAPCTPLADFPAKQAFIAGNPIIEVTKGMVHLYSPCNQNGHHLMVCLMAVPADVSCSELLKFVSPFGGYIKNVRIIRDAIPNQYMALVDFHTEARANEFYRHYHGRQFNTMEPNVCSVAFVSKLEILKTEQGAALPSTGATELPNCPVCLERLDESLLTALCNHRFHVHCLEPWQCNRCPLCRYALSPEPVGDNRCMDCGSHESLWICLICGHVGCGRYAEGHAKTHFLSTQHTYAMDIGSQSVWDYAGDNFVHRLVQSTTDGKLVEVQEPSSSAKDDVTSTQKWEGLQLEYTFLLTNQLESQRLYFEEKVSMVQDELSSKLHQAERQCRELQERLQELQQQTSAAEKQRQASDKKFTQVSERLTDVGKQLQEEKVMTSYLRANQQESQERLQLVEKTGKEQVDAKDKAIQDLEEQLRDVMFYINAQKTVSEMTDSEDKQALQDGHVTVGGAAAASKTTPSRSHRKKRR